MEHKANMMTSGKKRAKHNNAQPWLEYFDTSELLIAACRYFIGRMTIATCHFAEHLAIAWPQIPKDVQAIIRQDVEEAFERDDRVRENSE